MPFQLQLLIVVKVNSSYACAQANSHFGERALFKTEPRAATVIATSKVEGEEAFDWKFALPTAVCGTREED